MTPITVVICKGRMPYGFKSLLSLLVFFFLFSLCCPPAQAQLKRFPLRQNAVPVPVIKNKSATGRTKADALKLPFWDDFSFTPVNDSTDALSNFPLDSLWAYGRNVSINNGIGINPPTLNIATFDGLKFTGVSYADQPLYNGFRDTLTSQPILLGSEVDLIKRSTVYLSFFYQWQGNGEAPDESDYLLVEFKNDQDKWESVMTISPRLSFSRTDFYDTIVKVDGDRFFHDDFQFRFRNYGRQSGPYDTWNIDYVYLNKNRNANDLTFPDRAITSQLGLAFGRYRSIPINHFLPNKTLTVPAFDIYNLQDTAASINYRANAEITNYYPDDATIVYNTVLGDSIPLQIIGEDSSGFLGPLQRKTITTLYLPDAAQFHADVDSVLLKYLIVLNSNDNVYKDRRPPLDTDSTGDYTANYKPIDFRSNDIIRASYSIAKHYAYDDGVAEYAAGLTQAGNRAAYQFDMMTTTPDTLVGFYIYFPNFALTASLTADFYVYSDDGGKPGNILYSFPSVTVQGRGLNTFQFFKIVEPFLVSDKFYIGWKAPVGGTLQVGLDLSNDTGDKIFVNTNGSWIQNTDISGSLMIRTKFGSGDIVTGIPEEKTALSAYPNPNTGEFFISERIDGLEIITVTGQAVSFRKEDQENQHKISVINGTPGLYILKLRKNNTIITQKIILK